MYDNFTFYKHSEKNLFTIYNLYQLLNISRYEFRITYILGKGPLTNSQCAMILSHTHTHQAHVQVCECAKLLVLILHIHTFAHTFLYDIAHKLLTGMVSIAKYFYNVKNRSSIIMSKSSSKNLSNENKHW